MMFVRSIVSVLLVFALAGCGGEVTVPAPDPAPGAGQFGLTERAFVELEIATDDQAVLLLDLGAQRVATPALRDLAREIGAAHRTELAELHGLLVAAAVQYVNNHGGHDMPGMPTNEELTSLRNTTVGFDGLFAGLLRAHLDESAGVAKTASQSMSHQETRVVATRMEQDRRLFLQRLGQTSVAS
jgi:uncharacterized protein (DUF305 family)